MSAGEQPSGASGPRSPGKHPPDWVILTLVCLGVFMVILDVSVVNVALPAIRASLGFSQTGLQWVVNAYTLTFAGFLLLGGRAADLYGRRRVFLIGLSIFTVASLVGGLAQNQAMLVTARAVQGFGGAILSPATLTILITTFTDPKARARALGIWSAVAAGGGAVGVLLGGVLTQLLSWRWILFINIPVGVALLVGAIMLLPETRGMMRSKELDLWGALTITGSLVSLVYAVVNTDGGSWTGWQTLVGLPLAAVLFVAFVVIEAHDSAPLVPLRLFRSRSLTGANLVMLLLSAALFAMWFFLSLYMQNVLGYSPLRAGVRVCAPDAHYHDRSADQHPSGPPRWRAAVADRRAAGYRPGVDPAGTNRLDLAVLPGYRAPERVDHIGIGTVIPSAHAGSHCRSSPGGIGIGLRPDQHHAADRWGAGSGDPGDDIDAAHARLPGKFARCSREPPSLGSGDGASADRRLHARFRHSGGVCSGGGTCRAHRPANTRHPG